jgi:SAM-dependent methyltransferase
VSERYDRQAAEIIATFAGNIGIDILDYGCGSGALLRKLSSLGFESLYGVDFSPQPEWEHVQIEPNGRGPRFLLLDHEGAVPEPASEVRYDLIVVSHVLEHLLEFKVLAELFDLLKAGGKLYVEVPDAARYHEFERLEFFYYFDRLHVNHFSSSALERLLSGFGFGLSKSFHYRFAYSGGDFPALGCFFNKADSVQSVTQAFRQYTASEMRRAGRLKDSVTTIGLPLLVYGAGDNFHRSFNAGGPLADLDIGCVLDRNHEMFPDGLFGIPVLAPEEGLKRFPGSPVAVTVSSGRGEVKKLIQRIDGRNRKIFDV